MIRNQINMFKLTKIVRNNRRNKEPGLLSWLSDGLHSGRVEVRYVVGENDFSVFQIVQTGFGATQSPVQQGPEVRSL